MTVVYLTASFLKLSGGWGKKKAETSGMRFCACVHMVAGAVGRGFTESAKASTGDK